MSTFQKPNLKHSGLVLIIAIDDKFLTIKNTSTIDVTISATSGATGGDVIATECVRWHPACHCNFQNSQPALFEVQAIAGESVADFGLV